MGCQCSCACYHFQQLPERNQEEVRRRKGSLHALQVAMQRVITKSCKLIMIDGAALGLEKDVKAIMSKVKDCIKQCEAIAKAMRIAD